MNKFKIIYQKVKKFVTKNWLICAGSLSFILLILLFFPIFRSSWVYYPESLRARIAIKKLANSEETAFYCREDCQAKRILYKNIISSALIKEPEKLLPDLERLILNSKTLPEIRNLVIQIWQTSEPEPSTKIKEFYANSSNPIMLRADLARAWPQLAVTPFYVEIIGNFKMAKTDQEKIDLLSLLLGQDDQISLTTIWEIILGDYSDILKTKAWFLLANVTDKKSAYKLSDLDNLRAVLESGDYPHRLKDQAILVLSDYYLYYPEVSETLLIDVVNRTKYFDNYQRSFAIDILNRYRENKIPPPDLSQADWDAYFTN